LKHPQKTKANSSKRARLLENMLELPAGLISGSAHIELMGNREAIVDGCRGVLAYDENLVRLNAGNCIVKITGRSLNIKNLTQTQAIVEGFFLSLEFEV